MTLGLLLWISIVKVQEPSLNQIDTLVQARDYKSLSSLVDNLPADQSNPLKVISTNGAYECGKFGWHASEMKSPDSDDRYVVVHTPLTSEDIGDFLFRRQGAKLHLIPEDQSLGVHVVKNNLEVTFDLPNRAASLSDGLSIEPTGKGDFVFRMSEEFKVSTITDASGKPIPFAQAGGIVLLQKPSGPSALSIKYSAVVNHPLYSGSITTSEATLTNCYWYPMVARQPAPYEVTVHYPSDWIAVGQGVKLSEGGGVSHFRMDLPCVFYSLSAGPYKAAEFKDGEDTFYAWSPRLTHDILECQAETYDAIIKFYSRFSPFPFKTYGGLDSPQYGGGALEAYSYATYGGGFPEVDAHEPSHTWWGGILDNTYLHSFWNESFAVFSDGLYHREWSDNEGTRLAFIPQGEVNEGYDRLACARSGADSGPIGSDLGYGKGSHVLFLLETLIGRDAMIRSMQRFISDQPKEVPAEWSDFEKAAIKENPGKNLQTFFDDWLHRPGHLEMKCTVDLSGGELRVNYEPVGEAYRIPLQILIGYPDGTRDIRIFDVREAKQIAIKTRSKPMFVSVDPYRFLIRHVQPDERPLSFSSTKRELQVYVDPAHLDWGEGYESSLGSVPEKLAGVLLIGSPQTLPAIASLCKKVGFEVHGNSLSYQGVSVDLNKGGAVALVDLGNGKVCGLCLGKSRIRPETGNARIALYDDLGRMIAGETDPKTSGNLTFHSFR